MDVNDAQASSRLPALMSSDHALTKVSALSMKETSTATTGREVNSVIRSAASTETIAKSDLGANILHGAIAKWDELQYAEQDAGV